MESTYAEPSFAKAEPDPAIPPPPAPPTLIILESDDDAAVCDTDGECL